MYQRETNFCLIVATSSKEVGPMADSLKLKIWIRVNIPRNYPSIHLDYFQGASSSYNLIDQTEWSTPYNNISSILH